MNACYIVLYDIIISIVTIVLQKDAIFPQGLHQIHVKYSYKIISIISKIFCNPLLKRFIAISIFLCYMRNLIISQPGKKAYFFL